nr:unnamed protein product [Callosobruchus chinensis]
MASVLCRRLLARRTLRMKDFPFLVACPSTNVMVNDTLFEQTINGCHENKNLVVSLPNSIYIKYYSTQPDDKQKCGVPAEETEKLTLFQKFKKMYRDYWYVLVPVHLVTSAFWFGGFYYAAKSGIDIVGILESWNVSEKLLHPLRDSSMGYIAVTLALYKIATPLRYTVTLGGTTISINYLKKWGYIKPVPSRERLKEMYHDKKEIFSRTMKETREEMLERKDNIMESIQEKKEEIKDKKDSLLQSVNKTKSNLRIKTKDVAQKLPSSEIEEKSSHKP